MGVQLLCLCTMCVDFSGRTSMVDLAGTCANCSQELAAANSLCIGLPTEVGMHDIASSHRQRGYWNGKGAER
jgi:hypothetical protein